MSQEKAEGKRYEEDLKLKTAEEPGVKRNTLCRQILRNC